MTKESESGSIHIKVGFDRLPEEEINLIVYVFDERGNLLQEAPLKEGKAALKVDPARLRTARLFVAPEMPPGIKLGSLADMECVRAYEPLLEFDPHKRVYELRPIPQILWKWWLWCRCRVRGKVVKPVMIADISIERPVCEARVHICEVDRLPILIPRLPDPVVFRLRDELVKQLVEPPRLRRPPLPDPPPERKVMSTFRPPGPIELVTLDPQPEPPPKLLKRGDLLALTEVSPQPEPVGSSVYPNLQPTSSCVMFDQLPAASQAGLLSESSSVVRETLLENAALILPYLCLWPWIWPHICRCDELTTVVTDHTGRFDTEIWYPCLGDHPDLYFWVEYWVEGAWTTVYRPTVCCHTYWNYACGNDVTIRVTDPRVHGCEPAPDLSGLQVVIAAIGNTVSFAEIIQPGTGWAFMGDTGLTSSPNTDVASYLPPNNRPFAGSLELRMDMSRSNLIALGITHYRWSYRRVKKADGTNDTDTWHPMSRDVFRHYKVQVADSAVPGGWRPAYPTEKLGIDPAVPGEYLTRIQPVPTPVGDYNWTPLNEHVDMAWAYFDTAGLVEPDTAGTESPVPAAGKYELKLELFKVSGSTTTLVNWSHPAGPGSSPINIFVAHNAAPFMPPTGMTTAPAGADHLLKNASGDVVGFCMVVHVDNRICAAAIDDVVVRTPGHPDDHGGPCGFVRFPNRLTSRAAIGFLAWHPHQHADFYFRVDKGSVGPVGHACAGWLPAPTPGGPDNGSVIWVWSGAGVNGFARDAASHFTKTVPVDTLLNSHGVCLEAAFAETIYVAARATDGYQRAYWLDAVATPKAFALAPKVVT